MKPRLLRTAALGAVLGLAGCSGGNGGSSLNGPGGGGGRIAFVTPNNELMLVDADGRNLRTLTPEGGQSASISRNGRRIAYQSYASGEIPGTVAGGLKIFVINSDGSGQKKLTEGSADGLPIINRDGSQIAFLRSVSAHNDIFIINTTGNGLRRLTQDNRQKTTLSFSPNNSKIAFTAQLNNPLNGSQTGGLFVLDANAGSVAANNERQILSELGLRSPAFLPDGRIVFLAPDASTNSRKIDIVDADGTDRGTLIAGANLPAGNIGRISVSPDGSRLVYDVFASNNDVGIWTQPISGGAATRLDLPTVVGAFSPTWGDSVQ